MAWATAGSPRAFPSAQLPHSRYSRDSEQRYEPVSSNLLSCAVRLLATACARRPRAPRAGAHPRAGKAAQSPVAGGHIAGQDELIPPGLPSWPALLPRQHVQQGAARRSP